MRNKMIELLDQKRCCFCDLCKDDETADKHIEETADHLLANGGTIQQWIPVSERLPDKNGRYLAISCSLNVHYIGIFIFVKEHREGYERYFIKSELKRKNTFYWYDAVFGFHMEKNITHWMPLPEPPKG